MRVCFLNKTKFSFATFLLIALIIGFLNSCERDAFKPGRAGQLSFSKDTVMFDTIFTNLGTATYKLTVINPHNYKVVLDSVYLAGGVNSNFKVNIDGDPSSLLRHLTINSKDSLYIFIQAYIKGTNENDPFLNLDSIVFVSGENVSDVKLWAVGQNVIPFHNDRIQSQEWNNSKPYLIMGTLTVDSGAVLKIHEGTKIYFQKNANISVNGTLQVLGTFQAPVSFRGSRLESDYDSIPGEWGGINLKGNDQVNVISNAVIRNGNIGIAIGDYRNTKKVKLALTNTIISNMGYSALIAYQAEIEAKNCVFANSNNTICKLLYGGKYSFTHCTFANYGAMYVGKEVGEKTLILQNYIDYIDSNNRPITAYNNLENAFFGNSVIYGDGQSEIAFNKKGQVTFNYTFDRCLIKTTSEIIAANSSSFIECIADKAPKFIKPGTENFRLDTLSPAKDFGKLEFGNLVPLDLDNNSRISDLKPDLGAYERIEK